MSNNNNPSPEQIAEKQSAAAATKNNNDNNTQPVTIKLNNNSQEDFQNQKLKKTKQSRDKPAVDTTAATTTSNETTAVAKDNTGNVNVSRGIIGLKTEEEEEGLQPESAYITDGTVADFVYPPSKFPTQKGTEQNPITEEDLQKRIDLERQKAGMDYARQEQIAVKLRTEMQGFQYQPPEEFANDPELAPTQTTYQRKEPNADAQQGEQVINVNENTNQSEEEGGEEEQVIATEPQENQQQQQQDNIKG